MKVFTIHGGSSYLGAEISNLPYYDSLLQGILVGTDTNGTKFGFLRVSVPDDVKTITGIEISETGGKFLGRVSSGKDDSQALIVLRTPVFKGGKNFHTGDVKSSACFKCEVEYDGLTITCGYCGRKLKTYYSDFPAKVIARGTVRNSKKPHFGEQLIAVVKKGKVFRTAYNGYVWPNPGAHFHFFDGVKIVTQTSEERKAGRLF